MPRSKAEEVYITFFFYVWQNGNQKKKINQMSDTLKYLVSKGIYPILIEF